jgi:hypothetical protein
MSLKTFHIIFIVASTVLAVGFCAWLTWNYFSGGGWVNLAGAVLSLGAAVGLIVYERYFLKKTKNLSYL